MTKIENFVNDCRNLLFAVSHPIKAIVIGKLSTAIKARIDLNLASVLCLRCALLDKAFSFAMDVFYCPFHSI